MYSKQLRRTRKKRFYYTFDLSSLHLRRNVECIRGRRDWSHEVERKDQELKNRMCSTNVESDPRTQTFMFHTHPSPLCVSVCVKLQLQWSCDEPKKSLGTVDLADFLVCARKKICTHVTWTRFWVIGDTILLHGRVHSSSAGVIRKVVTWSLPKNLLVYVTWRRMRTKRHTDIWTCLRTQHTRKSVL
jgi:hypothetical protein